VEEEVCREEVEVEVGTMGRWEEVGVEIDDFDRFDCAAHRLSENVTMKSGRHRQPLTRDDQGEEEEEEEEEEKVNEGGGDTEVGVGGALTVPGVERIGVASPCNS